MTPAVSGLYSLLSLPKILHFDILLQYSTFYDTFAEGPKATFLLPILHAIFILLSSMHYRNFSFSLFLSVFFLPHPLLLQDIVGYYLNPFSAEEGLR